MNSLRSEGFCEKHFYVPFSNWDYPEAEQFKWNSLREKARQSYEEVFIKDCVLYCDEHHISIFSKDVLGNCFEIPATGVKVKNLYFEDCYYSIINFTCFDSIAADLIGHFCTNNGKVVFVYQNGKNYVAKGDKILYELHAAGYTESSLFVPFSNGEQIQDCVLKARWESITK